MIISGFRKMTLLDYPDKIAATIFTGGCNFRCPFCHNASLVTGDFKDKHIAEEQVLGFLKKRKGILDGVCITGGEPLINEDIAAFLYKVKALGFLVKLDTNGSFPERMKDLINSSLIDYVAMDIKNSPEKYADTAGFFDVDFSKIDESVNILMKGDIPYEFRTTMVKPFHEKEDFIKISKWLFGADKYFLQAFENSGNLIGNNMTGFSKEEAENIKNLISSSFLHIALRGY